MTNALRERVTEDAHFWRLFAEYTDIDYKDRPAFYGTRARARAKVLTLRELDAPDLLIEEAEVRLRVVNQLADDPAWENRKSWDLDSEARMVVRRTMSKKPGFSEQAKQWRRWLYGGELE